MLDYEFWIMDVGLWIINYGLWSPELAPPFWMKAYVPIILKIKD